MAWSSGTSSGSSIQMQNSGSEEDLMDQRKRKRMISNRESARRSRMRKQKHLDDLTVQVSQLRKENHQIVTSLNITTQHYLKMEAENSVLRAQLEELSRRLESLNEINDFLNCKNANNNHNNYDDANNNGDGDMMMMMVNDHGFDGYMNMNNPLTFSCLNQPIMASPDFFQY